METRNDIEELVPFKATHPGAVIAEELEYMGVKHSEFAQLIGMQPTHFSSLLKGRRSLSADVALEVEHHTELKAEHLMALQSKYDFDCERIEQRRTADEVEKIDLGEIAANINLAVRYRRESGQYNVSRYRSPRIS